jgi:hypothetical protein
MREMTPEEKAYIWARVRGATFIFGILFSLLTIFMIYQCFSDPKMDKSPLLLLIPLSIGLVVTRVLIHNK